MIKSNHNRCRGQAPGTLVLALFALSFTTNCLAEKWYFEPNVTIRTAVDDNVRLSVNNEESAFSTLITGKADFGFRTEVSDVKFYATLADRRYSGIADLNSQDKTLGLTTALRSGLNLYSFSGSIFRDSTRTSELETTGLVQANKQRTRISLNPSWTRTLTERASLKLGLAYTDVGYEDALNTGLVDYTYKQADAFWSYQLSPQTEAQLLANVSRYEAPVLRTQYDTYGVRAGFSHQLSETSSASALVGLSKTDSEFFSGGVARQADDMALLLDLRYIKNMDEVQSFDVGLSMSESPGGSGDLLRATKLSFNAKRRLSTRLDFSLNASLTENETGGGVNNTGNDRTYLSLEPKLSWRATEWWNLTGGYRYRQQEYTSSSAGTADSNMIYFTARYTWPRENYNRWMDL